MEWLILATAYVLIGIAVFAWYIRGNETIHSDQKRRTVKMLILCPELCLFWPVALFTELKKRRAVSRATSTHSE
jgi:dipeptide/tripeptide permease